MKKRRKLDVSCPNPSCQFFDKKGCKNIVRRGKKQMVQKIILAQYVEDRLLER